jgi:hypothetical protein
MSGNPPSFSQRAQGCAVEFHPPKRQGWRGWFSFLWDGVFPLPQLSQDEVCRREFILQYLRVTSKLMEFFAKFPAFRFLGCQLVLQRG